MFNSGILDVAIGLTFVFILVSTLCSAIREGIEAWLKTRATYLEFAIRELFRDPDGNGLTKRFFEHPLIHGLFQGEYTPRDSKATLLVRGGNLPSYISAKSFAAALMDLAAHGPDANAPEQLEPITFKSLRQSVSTMPNVHVARALMSAIDSAQGDLDKVRTNLEGWYDSTMDRVSGWYKRSTQKVIFFVALFVVVALNVNVITIADSLYRNQALRDAAVAAAGKQGAGEIGYSGALKTFDELRLPIGWSGGWGAPRSAVEKQLTRDSKASFELWNDVLAPLLGLLATAFAATLGAPFWFDVLNRVMVIRASVKPDEKSPEVGSKDRMPQRAGSAPQAPVVQFLMPHGTTTPTPNTTNVALPGQVENDAADPQSAASAREAR
jgi:hypothetical protein